MLPATTENQTQSQLIQCFSFDTAKTYEEALKYAQDISKTELCPKIYRSRPHDIVVCTQFGKELGLKYFQSLQSICVINGIPSIYGDAALALCFASGLIEEHEEWHSGSIEDGNLTAHVRVKRYNKKVHVETFSMADAKLAELWGSKDTWKKYPKRMLLMRARSFALRGNFPDVLKGIGFVEDAYDLPADQYEVLPDNVSLPAPNKAKNKGSKRAAKVIKNVGQFGDDDASEATSSDASNTGGKPEAEQTDDTEKKEPSTIEHVRIKIDQANTLIALYATTDLCERLPEANKAEARKLFKDKETEISTRNAQRKAAASSADDDMPVD